MVKRPAETSRGREGEGKAGRQEGGHHSTMTTDVVEEPSRLGRTDINGPGGLVEEFVVALRLCLSLVVSLWVVRNKLC